MAKSSPLLDLHRSNGAILAEQDGWLLPAHFGEPLREYFAVRNRVGILDLCQRTVLELTGDDRVSFLNGMVSNDVKTLVPGQGTHAAFLDLQGKILADTRVLCTSDTLLFDLIEPVTEKILRHLRRHIVADDVEIQDLSAEYTLLSVQGPKAGQLIREASSTDQLPLRDLDHTATSVGLCRVHVIRATHTVEEGYDLLIRRTDLASALSKLREIGKELSLVWVGTDAQEMLRVEAGIPRYGKDMTEDNLLLETGLDQAVSFHKGCYLGQEVVERIHSRGHVNRHLAGLILKRKEPVQPGATIHQGSHQIGKVTSSIFSPDMDSAVALGYVQRDSFAPGKWVTVQDRENGIPAALCALPIRKPSSLPGS
jgi:folate-binding protein YgfZ